MAYLTYLTILKPTYPPPNTGSKKQRIWALVSDGNYSPDEIASKVGTTIEYVWKETSRYKKARTGTGLVMSKTMELSKRKAETSIFLQQSDLSQGGTQDFSVSKSQAQIIPADNINLNSKSDRFLNLPKMESSDLKMLYNEFNAGKKPVDVIAKFGYHPEIVESEYGRFLRLSGIDIDALLKHIITDCGRIMEPSGELKRLVDKYHEEGKFRNEDIYKLLSLKSEHEWQSSLIVSIRVPMEAYPDKIVPLKCSLCKKTIPGALINSKFELGTNILNHFANYQCYHCRNPKAFEVQGDAVR